MDLQRTGRHCSNCKSELTDFAVDWKTPLPHREFSKAHKEFKLADLCVVLGSSLRIRPAGNLPLRTIRDREERNGQTGKSDGSGNGTQSENNKFKKKRGKLVIINLQETHLDGHCSLRIWAKCDVVMRKLCQLLNVQIPQYDSNVHTYETPYQLPPDSESEEDESDCYELSADQKDDDESNLSESETNEYDGEG